MLESITKILDTGISSLASFVATLIELVGVIIIIVAVTRHLYKAIKIHKFDVRKIHKDKEFNITLSVALENLLAAEILKTLTVNGDFTNLIEVVLLIIVRIMMAFVLHLENKESLKNI